MQGVSHGLERMELVLTRVQSIKWGPVNSLQGRNQGPLI